MSNYLAYAGGSQAGCCKTFLRVIQCCCQVELFQETRFQGMLYRLDRELTVVVGSAMLQLGLMEGPTGVNGGDEEGHKPQVPSTLWSVLGQPFQRLGGLVTQQAAWVLWKMCREMHRVGQKRGMFCGELHHSRWRGGPMVG